VSVVSTPNAIGTWDQAEERVPEGRGNKGFEAAAAAIEMALLFRRLRAGGRR
jgi:6,7-dimethyl-8-ribityllumazine synthase